MRIVSLNLNGLRSAAAKGLFDWLPQLDADLICCQETRLQAHQRVGTQFELPGYTSQFVDAQAKGYSGVAIYARQTPERWLSAIGVDDFDAEGRWLQADFGGLSVISLYLPSGSSGAPRQAFKFATMQRLKAHLDALRADGRQYVLCGDWNIAHRELDLKNWRGNRKNSGFLPEERAWLEQLLVSEGWVDTHRALKPEVAEYTWWSNRGNAYQNDVGWRIDYQIASPNLAGVARAVSVHRTPRFSDHAPLVVDYDLPRLSGCAVAAL